MPQIYDMGPTTLLPLRRKNPTASAGFEPPNLGTKGQHATPRPPKSRTGLPTQNKMSWLTNGSPPLTNFLDIRNASPVLCYILEYRINNIQILQTDCLETIHCSVQFIFNLTHSYTFPAAPKICVELLRK